jgi:hypothetical protein
MTADLIAAPLPAEATPLRDGEKPSQSFRMALKVPKPNAAGRERSHHLRERARELAKSRDEAGLSIKLWATKNDCSVSSLIIPRPGRNR